MPAREFTSIVELDTAAHVGWWAEERDAIRSALSDGPYGEVSGAQLTPPGDPAALRARLRGVAPRLAALTERVRDAFDGPERACTVLVTRLGLAGEPLDDRRKGVFALAALLGDVTANIPFEHAFWDVRSRGEEMTRHSSFSENDREADYHTDSGYLLVPERFFLLYAVRAATCGGGVSMIRDGRMLRAALAATSEGREALRVLAATKLPTRIPRAFRKDGYVAKDGYQYTPVLADLPMWRWRKDKLYQGLDKYPSYDTARVRRALDTVADLLAHGADEVYQVLPTDGLLIVNNHIALHGRTAFTDPERHLLRIRVHEPGTAAATDRAQDGRPRD